MNETAETKVCPFCAEKIKAAAKKCPFCNSRLFKHALFLQEFVLGLSLVFMVGCFVVVCASEWPDGSDEAGRSFAWHRKDLDATNVQASLENHGTNDFYYHVTGVVTNKGDYPWRVQEFELTVTNTQGVADIRHTEVNEAFVVQSHTAHEFVIQCRTGLTNAVIIAQVRVENARDGNLPPREK
jgi:hypothetical protein